MSVHRAAWQTAGRRRPGRLSKNNHVVINNDGTNGQIGPAALKAVYDMAARVPVMKFRHRCVMVACSPEVDDEDLPLKVKPGMDVASVPSVRRCALVMASSQRAPAGLNANLKTYSVTLSVPREEATVLESFLEEHGGWKSFLWTPPYGGGR